MEQDRERTESEAQMGSVWTGKWTSRGQRGTRSVSSFPGDRDPLVEGRSDTILTQLEVREGRSRFKVWILKCLEGNLDF